MATVATIIDRSLRLLGQIPSGGHATTEEYADGLVALNALLDGWRNEKTMCYATRTESLTLSASTTSYTIGPAGDLVTTRPVDIEDAWIVQSNITYPVRVVTDGEYDAITTKTQSSSWPELVNYRGTMPAGTLYVWPPANAARTLNLRTRTPFTAFAATTDTVSLPPGWEDALAFNLAINMAPEFQTEASNSVVRRAMETRAAIKLLNSAPIMAVTELGAIFSSRKANILTDQ